MPTAKFRGYDVHYEFYGTVSRPTIVFVNGLSMRTNHWEPFVKRLTAQNISVLLYDMLGQGASSKPVLGATFSENADAIACILDEMGIEKAYVAGISFGGVVVEEFGIRYPEKTKGLIPISTFSELDGQLRHHSHNLHMAMTQIGFEGYLNLIMPLNFTSMYLEKMADVLGMAKRITSMSLQVYGIQNLMESLADFKSITGELHKITAPTLILNAEHDYFTPRHVHEVIRRHIKNSKLMIVQHYCHAFTLEIPDISCRIITDFIDQVENDTWVGDQSVWIAEDSIDSDEIAYPCEGDHLRFIPSQPKTKSKANSKATLRKQKPSKQAPATEAPEKRKATKAKPPQSEA